MYHYDGPHHHRSHPAAEVLQQDQTVSTDYPSVFRAATQKISVLMTPKQQTVCTLNKWIFMCESESEGGKEILICIVGLKSPPGVFLDQQCVD